MLQHLHLAQGTRLPCAGASPLREPGHIVPELSIRPGQGKRKLVEDILKESLEDSVDDCSRLE
jgi:hypothetical protein